jgi:hypothetical protein
MGLPGWQREKGREMREINPETADECQKLAVER